MMTEKEAWTWLAEQLQSFHLHTYSVNPFGEAHHVWIKTYEYTMGSYGLCRHVDRMVELEMIDNHTFSTMKTKIDIDLGFLNTWLFECDFAGLMQRIIYCKQKTLDC